MGGLPGVPLIQVSAVGAQSATTCSAVAGVTNIAYLSVGSAVLVPKPGIPFAPNTTIALPNLVKVVINEQLPVAGADKGLTVNAIHITIPGLVDLIIASATTDIHNCPKAPPPPR